MQRTTMTVSISIPIELGEKVKKVQARNGGLVGLISRLAEYGLTKALEVVDEKGIGEIYSWKARAASPISSPDSVEEHEQATSPLG